MNLYVLLYLWCYEIYVDDSNNNYNKLLYLKIQISGSQHITLQVGSALLADIVFSNALLFSHHSLVENLWQTYMFVYVVSGIFIWEPAA